MPRKARVQKTGYYYHIIARGQRKNPLFFSYKDMNVFMKYLRECIAETDIELIAFCVMRNHYHLLVRKNKDYLDKLMHPLNTRYAIYFNKKYEKEGHVFQGRFISLPVLGFRYLYTAVNYIHNNPSKAGIVKKPEQYVFSSARDYIIGKRKQYKYLKIIDFSDSKLFNTESVYHIKNRYIGYKSDYMRFFKRQNGRQLSRDRDMTSRNELIKFVISETMELFGSSIEEISFYKYSKKNRKLKKIVKYLKNRGLSQAEISRSLGYSRSAISKILSNKR